jgi:Holliday junction resolvase RusA-like endonuclease
MRIARTATGRPFILPSLANQVWHRDAVRQLRAQWVGPRGTLPALIGPVSVHYDIVLKNHQHEGDADNYMAAINDALQAAGVIANDKQIRCGTFAKRYDPGNPRVEIMIHAVEEVASTGVEPWADTDSPA